MGEGVGATRRVTRRVFLFVLRGPALQRHARQRIHFISIIGASAGPVDPGDRRYAQRKSRFAVELAKTFGRRIIYVATCRPADAEMRRRIAQHRRARPRHWVTLEPSDDLRRQLVRLTDASDGVIFDCLTMYVAGRLMRERSDAAMQRDIRRLCETIRQVRLPIVVVTNEVGSGIVPDHPLGRRFRDLAGMANQLMARCADQVILMVSGIPLVVKDGATTPRRAR